MVGGWEGYVVPMYHPASGLHDTRQMKPMVEDWRRLKEWMKGTWAPPTQIVSADYHLFNTLNPSLHTSWGTVAVDTESVNNKLWSIQTSAETGIAMMYKYSDLIADKLTSTNRHYLGRLKNLLEASSIIFHNAEHDLNQLAQINIKPSAYRDTMQEAYHLVYSSH